MLILSSCTGAPSHVKGKTKPNQTAVSTEPHLQKRFNAAVSLMRQDQLDKAKSSLQALIDQHPRLPGPYINLGIIQINEGEPAEAEASFTSAIELKPDSLPAHNQLGIALRMQGKFEQAEKSYRKAMKLNPDYQLVHCNLGILYDLYLGKSELALEHYKRCQALGETENREISGWILDLERRIKASK
jgi:tetratricopeptide (TPR) repeat protein